MTIYQENYKRRKDINKRKHIYNIDNEQDKKL